METFTNTEKLDRARRRVKKVKGFYSHALIYAMVNQFIIMSHALVKDKGFENIDAYYTAIFWGFGLLMHWISVFAADSILGYDWEERKIRELMEREK